MYLKQSTEKLIQILRFWIEDERRDKIQKPIYKIFCRTLKDLEKEFKKQKQIFDRLISCSPELTESDDEAFRTSFSSGGLLKRNDKRQKSLRKKIACNFFFELMNN